jgi:pimeloyl-ACP methyl ester carboxylesterase
VTIQSAAFVAHQLVQGLRNGSMIGIQFGKVIIVGHSLSSLVVWVEAINYGDVDGVIGVRGGPTRCRPFSGSC